MVQSKVRVELSSFQAILILTYRFFISGLPPGHGGGKYGKLTILKCPKHFTILHKLNFDTFLQERPTVFSVTLNERFQIRNRSQKLASSITIIYQILLLRFFSSVRLADHFEGIAAVHSGRLPIIVVYHVFKMKPL